MMQSHEAEIVEEVSIRRYDVDSPQGRLFVAAMTLVRRVLPCSFVGTAFWLSFHSLQACDLAVLHVTNQFSKQNHKVSFGLWAFSDQAGLTQETCQYGFDTHDDNQGLSSLFVVDASFKAARVLGVMAVSFGFVTMVSLWGAVFRESMLPRKWRMWLGLILTLCCILESLTMLLIFRSRSCRGHDRNCQTQQGFLFFVFSCVFWILALLALTIMWPQVTEIRRDLFAFKWGDIWESIQAETRHPTEAGYVSALSQPKFEVTEL